MQKVKNIIMGTVAALMMALPGAALTPAVAVFAADSGNDIANQVCTGSNAGGQVNASQGVDCAGSNGGIDIGGIAKNVINIFSIIVGAVAVIMIIYGGFRYITSGGDSNNVGTAKNTLIYAIIGLIIVALAQVIVHFVLGQATTTVGS